LPAKPQIFHGRQAELDHIVEILLRTPARIAILGPGGMGKTSLAKAALHHSKIAQKYQHCYFVVAESSITTIDLAMSIAEHIGLEPTKSKDVVKQVATYFSRAKPSLLILDNLETVWEPEESQGGVEEFLSKL
ncbi:P-loop containing nucleoside triphosphate hydrolase protein, partial [Mycena crocata]